MYWPVMVTVLSVEIDIYWPVMVTVPSMELDIYWPVMVTVPTMERVYIQLHGRNSGQYLPVYI